MRPLLEGKEIKLDRPLFWHYPHYGNQGGNPSSIIQKNGWKLIHYWEDGSDELYNVYTDIGEQNNLSKKFPDRVLSLRSELLSWLKEVNAKTPSVDERFDAKLAAARREEIINQKLPALEKERLLLLSKDFEPNPDWWGSQLTKD